MGAKSTEAIVNSFVSYTRAVAAFVPIKNVGALQNALKKDYILKELSTVVGSLALRCGWLLAVANTSLITMQHVDFEKKAKLKHRDADRYPLDGLEEVPCTEQTTD